VAFAIAMAVGFPLDTGKPYPTTFYSARQPFAWSACCGLVAVVVIDIVILVMWWCGRWRLWWCPWWRLKMGCPSWCRWWCHEWPVVVVIAIVIVMWWCLSYRLRRRPVEAAASTHLRSSLRHTDLLLRGNDRLQLGNLHVVLLLHIITAIDIIR